MQTVKGYGYSDLLLVPAYSELHSRQDPDITGVLSSDLILETPIISAAMDTVTEYEMAIWMAQRDALGIIHRYMPISNQVDMVHKVKLTETKRRAGVAAAAMLPVAASIGANESWERAEALIKAKVDMIAIDVAHGDNKSVYDIIKRIKDTNSMILVLSGNIATPEAAERAARAGADLFRVGIGPGSSCTTRLVTGVGVPQLTAIHEIHKALPGYPIVADGGIQHSGDIVKALAAGAECVLVGGRLASYPWTPAPGSYRGMASFEALSNYKGSSAFTVEGASFNVNPLTEKEAEADFSQIIGGIQQGLAYLGARDVQELREKAKWVKISDLGYREGEAHFG